MEDEIRPKDAEFHRLADRLRQLGVSMLAYPAINRPLARPGSVAERELQCRAFDDSWGNATFEVSQEAGFRIAMVADHLFGLAALADAERVTISIASLVRPPLESLGAIDWLFEPDIEIRERVRRRYNLRLQSLAEQRNIIEGLPEPGREAAKVSNTTSILAIKGSAFRLGFRYQMSRSRHPGVSPTFWLDERVPSQAKLLTRVAGSVGDVGARNGRLVQRVTSAVIHGQAHGILPFLHEVQPSVEPGVARAAVGISLTWLAVLVGSVVLASNQVMHLLCRHYGWDLSRWDAVAQPALVDMRSWLQRPTR